MDTLGKGLFWLGFIVLIGVVFAYLIMMIAGSIAFATTTAVLLDMCGDTDRRPAYDNGAWI